MNTPVWVFIRVRLTDPKEFNERMFSSAMFWSNSLVLMFIALLVLLMHVYSGILLLRMSKNNNRSTFSTPTEDEVRNMPPRPAPNHVQLERIAAKREVAVAMWKKSLVSEDVLKIECLKISHAQFSNSFLFPSLL